MLSGCLIFESFTNKKKNFEDNIIEMLKSGSTDKMILEYLKKIKPSKETFTNILDKLKKEADNKKLN
tara:strand:+ start:4637 stop:4837 length:201 start_codon:yes stop_codon:yes gene_type:complete